MEERNLGLFQILGNLWGGTEGKKSWSRYLICWLRFQNVTPLCYAVVLVTTH